MLHVFKLTQPSRILIGQLRHFTPVGGITRIIFISNPHSVSYSMDPWITSHEEKPDGMARMTNNVYTTTHTHTHTHTHIHTHTRTHTHTRLRDLTLN